MRALSRWVAEVRNLAVWLVLAATPILVATSCGGDDVPPVPEDLRRFSDEPMQELGCAACHRPGGPAADAPTEGDLPTAHPTLEPRSPGT